MSKLRERAQEALNLYNYFNGAAIFDQDAVAVYYYNNRPDLNTMTEQEVVGKYLWEIHPGLDLENSTVMKALKTGIPTSNEVQTWKTITGEQITSLNTTAPIIEDGEIIGVVEVSRYLYEGDEMQKNGISLSDGEAGPRPLYTVDDIVSASKEIAQMKKTIRKVSKTDSSILIYGKTGTGKEMVAEAIHTGSSRREARFAALNCAAIPGQLLESLLFGSAKGGFTDAEDRVGLFESADGGTVFLDEVNNMELGLQAKILKAIEEQQVIRVGEITPRKINVRVLAATNQDPQMLVEQGSMREDLYYRLRVVQIDLPPLSERPGDIPLLTAHFIAEFNATMQKQIRGVDGQVAKLFTTYPWPGNIRQLRNTIEGAFNLADGEWITLRDISWYEEAHDEEQFYGLHFDGTQTFKELISAYEKQVITETLENSDSMQKAREKMGISRQNLNHKLHNYQIDKKFNIGKED